MKRTVLTVLLAFTVLFAFALTACADNDGNVGNEENGDGEVGNIEDESGDSGDAEDGDGEVEYMENKIVFTVGETELTATLADNSATEALVERLKTEPLTIHMNDYGGWEKVGSFGFSLPTSNEQITAQPCEFVLYQGNQLVIFYGSNEWSYTRLGKIDNVTQAELIQILGTGSVTINLSLKVI